MQAVTTEGYLNLLYKYKVTHQDSDTGYCAPDADAANHPANIDTAKSLALRNVKTNIANDAWTNFPNFPEGAFTTALAPGI